MRKLLTFIMAIALIVVAAASVQPAAAQDGTITPNLVPPTTTEPQIIKIVKPYYSNNWTWKITKVASPTSLLLTEGQTAFVNYEVSVSALKSGTYGVEGFVGIANNDPVNAATVTSLTDVMSDGTVVTFPGCPTPFTIPAGGNVKCLYDVSLPSDALRTNTASATIVVNGVTYNKSRSEPVDFNAANAVNLGETDECIDVTDTNSGVLGTVCASAAPKTFTYALSFSTLPTADVVLVCGENKHNNIASFLTNDTGTTGSASAEVTATVACGGGCTLTPGYWKTHSDRGPAPYDNAWKLVGPLEEDTIFFLSGQTWYNVFWTAPSGNAYYILAHAYMAAKINVMNGASAPANVTAALTAAEVLFNTYTPEQVSKLVKPEFTTLATLLDNYNNGYIGPGHCSE